MTISGIERIGSVFIAVRFEDFDVATAAFDRATSVMRGVGVLRFLDPRDPLYQLVLVLGEPGSTDHVEELGELLVSMGGEREYDVPLEVLSAGRGRRVRQYLAGQPLRVQHHRPNGRWVDRFGRES